MTEMSTVDAREQLAEVVNRAAYGKERVILTRRGKPLAAVVPMEDVEALQRLEARVRPAVGEPCRDELTPGERTALEELRDRALGPGHTESLAGAARPFIRRQPAPDADWDEAIAQAAARTFLAKAEE